MLIQQKPEKSGFIAEREGFEPPEVLPSTVFKTAAIDHSAISPDILPDIHMLEWLSARLRVQIYNYFCFPPNFFAIISEKEILNRLSVDFNYRKTPERRVEREV